MVAAIVSWASQIVFESWASEKFHAINEEFDKEEELDILDENSPEFM